jgi:hypothetical protein
MALGGCVAKQRPAVFLDPLFKAQDVQRIAVLKPIDGRIDTEIEVDLDAQLAAATADALRDRGYDAQVVVLGRDTSTLTLDELKDADATLIKELGPPDTRWVMVVGLVDVTTSLTFGSTGNAEIEGFMYDKDNGVLVWRDKGIGQAGQGGLLGMALVGAMDEAAISTAVTHLVTSLPQREETPATTVQGGRRDRFGRPTVDPAFFGTPSCSSWFQTRVLAGFFHHDENS